VKRTSTKKESQKTAVALVSVVFVAFGNRSISPISLKIIRFESLHWIVSAWIEGMAPKYATHAEQGTPCGAVTSNRGHRILRTRGNESTRGRQ
jgi:hypothetical protein